MMIRKTEAVHNQREQDGMGEKDSPSQLLAGFGAVIPKNRPEDFRTMREEFENGVANDVVAEVY